MRPTGLLLLFLLVACGKQQPTETAPPKVSAAPSTSEAPPPPPAPPPVESASAAPPAASSSAPVAEEPAPKVKVFSIGMHVANGPFDEETKKPYLKAVEPHYPELAKCWNKVNDKTKGGDVGVDLLIGPTGGKPKVSHPRTTVEGAGEAFMPCVVSFFESMEFGKPHSGGLQGVSYSVRFKPTK